MKSNRRIPFIASYLDAVSAKKRKKANRMYMRRAKELFQIQESDIFFPVHSK